MSISGVEPKLTISARVNPKDVVQVLRFFEAQKTPIYNRSDLVWAAFRFLADFAEQMGTTRPGTYEEALLDMENRGMGWPRDAHDRDIRKAWQFDSLEEMPPEWRGAMIEFMKNADPRRKDKPDLNNVIGSRADNGGGEEKEHYDFLSEIEDLDKELKEKGKEG